MPDNTAPTDDIERKLSAARTQLVIDKPFLGVLVLHLPLRAADADWCKTTATDARQLYYNPQYIDALTLEQLKFVLAHEALHCALSHFHRREHRVKQRWDIACDFAVNAILFADGLTPPPNALWRKAFAGMAAEEIYPYIKEHAGDETLDQHIYDEGESPESAHGRGSRASPPNDRHRPPTPPRDNTPTNDGATNAGVDRARSAQPPDEVNAAPTPLTAGEREHLANQWQLRLAGAAQQALRAGKLSAALARLVDTLLQPQLPWRMLLARYLTSIARTDYSFARPSRREGAALLPGLRAAFVDVMVAIDTSGSIEPDEMREFVAEIDALKGSLNARITLHACDAALDPDGPWTCEPWEELRLPKQLHGGGGTNFAPVFEWAAQLDRAPDLLIYFTDAEGGFPPHEPPFPVLWLVKGGAAVPWGQRVQLN